MKKWLIAVLVTVVAGGVIIAGNSYHQSQLDTTAREAMHVAMTDDTGRALGNMNATRFQEDDDESSEDEYNGDNETTADSNDSQEDTGGSNGESASTGNTGNGSSSAASNGSGNTSGGSSGSSGTVSASGLSEEDIVDTYYRQFERLQRQEQERVNELIQNAQNDLAAYRAGTSDKSQNELQVHYVEQVEALEKQADSRFDDIYRELTAALEENDYETDVAQEFRAVYEAEKESRRLEAINRLFQ